MICTSCHKEFELGKRKRQRFCSSRCKDDYHNRNKRFLLRWEKKLREMTDEKRDSTIGRIGKMLGIGS